jgi:GDP-D-mannose dehydratase
MLQQEASCDLVFGTGETHSVQEFVEEAFGYVNLDGGSMWRRTRATSDRSPAPAGRSVRGQATPRVGAYGDVPGSMSHYS